MNVSGFPALARLRCQTTQQSEVVIVNTQPVVDILIGNNTLNSAEVDFDLIQCDGNGLLNGTFDSVGQTPLAPPSPVGQAAITSLVGKGWTVTTDPWQFVFADGGGGFWDLVVDTAGNVGTTAGVAPATADVILADGFGGFWKVAVDVTGLRYTIADPGPATAAPVLFDGEGGFWQLVVDALGNLGATLVYHYPVYWEPITEIVTWTDTNGLQNGDFADFITTVDYATLTNVTASGLAITELIFDGTQLPALTTIDCSSSASLTNLKVTSCAALVTLDCNTCDITGTLDVSGLLNLATLLCNNNINLAVLNVTGCTSLANITASVCGLTSVDCTGLTSLTFFIADNSTAPITSLNFTNCTSLTFLDVSGLSGYGSVTTLIVDGCTSLDFLDCGGNSIASLDISTCAAMLDLEAINAGLIGAGLTIGGIASVQTIDCDGCPGLTSLDVSGCIGLLKLFSYSCSLTSLNVTGCSSLVDIDTSFNSLNQAAVDTVLCQTDVNGAINGVLNISNNSVPSAAGLLCSANLDPGKGWTVTHD